MRQVRPLSRGVGQARRDAHTHHRGKGDASRPRAAAGPLGHARSHLHLRPGTDAGTSDPVGPRPLSRRGGTARRPSPVSGGRLPDAVSVISADSVTLCIYGQPVTVPAVSTVFYYSRRLGTDIPAWCHMQYNTPACV